MSKIAVVTGASGGIGAALTDELTRRGFIVVGISRKKPAQCAIEYIEADVCDENAANAAIAEVVERHGALDLLVNNAGFGISGAVEFTELSDAKRQLDVNFFGTLCMTKAALPHLRRSRGRVVNMSSVAATLPIPYQAFYSASKAAINALTLALDNETKGFGVRACAVLPGDVRTGFTAARDKSSQGSELYPSLEHAVAVMEHDEQNGMPPKKVAKAVARAATAKKPRRLYTVGAKYKLFALLAKLLPASISNAIVGMIYK